MEGKGIPRQNCISLVRLLAALQVMTGHLVRHLRLPFPAPAALFWGYFTGVPIFFMISGYLIWFSAERSASCGGYLKKRFLRIYPELWIAVLLEIVTIVVFYRGWNARELALFACTQGSVLQFWTPDSLRGYGCGTPNGTLWTICVTVQFYLAAWFLYRLMHGKKRGFWVLGFALLTAASMAGQKAAEAAPSELVEKLYGQTVIKYGWLFWIGCFAAEYRERAVPFLSRYWHLFLLAAWIPYLWGTDLYAGYWVLQSLLLGCGLTGFSYRFPRLALGTDVSYGIFLYHMIIVNVFIQTGWVGSWAAAAAVIAITLILAYVSTVTAGRWSRKKKAAWEKAA